mmetsp:Transcript_64219/g.127026  ORF Transcript_64219/g.127026 Transcript_64219/m.127026 type:complete len:220 (-) Transcript_64219:132-791(-)
MPSSCALALLTVLTVQYVGVHCSDDSSCSVSPKAARSCPMALNTGSVGSCVSSECAATRGPTYCQDGTCYCIDGYCRYPATTLHIQPLRCRAAVPHSTCHLTRICWKGGLTTSSCVMGSCMCRSGMHVDCQGKCAFGWFPVGYETPAELNATINLEEEMELDRQEDIEIVANVAMFSLWVGCGVALLFGAVNVVRRKSRIATTGSPEYQKMHDDKLLVA